MEEMKNNKQEKTIETKPEVKEVSFAKYIINLREKRNLTQKALAEKIKVSDRTISKWENGLTVPDLINIRNICKELGVSANSVVLEKSTISDRFKDFLRFLAFLWKHIYNNIFKVIFAILFILLLIYFINNYNSVSMYILNCDSSDITIGNGYYIKTKVDTVLLIDNIELNNNGYDPDIDSLKLELYLIMNGDKVVIYEDDELEDIFINELTSYKDTFTSDVTREITKGLYLGITINNTERYDCKITLRKNFSNTRLIYGTYQNNTSYDSDYQKFLGIEDNTEINENYYKNYNRNYLSSVYGINVDTAEAEVKATNDDDNNLLKDLGYTYDKESDTYTKVDGDKTIIYKPQFDLLVSLRSLDNFEYKTYYYISNDRIDYYAYENNNLNNTIANFKYFVNEKLFECIAGNCKSYQSEIDYILAEYQRILETL